MANITLLGANYNDVPAVTLPQTGGGVATFYEYDAKGKMPELLQTIYDAETALAATSFNGWSPSTTAKSIQATKTAGTFAANFAKYDYLLKWEFSFVPVLNEGATKKAQLIWEGADLWQSLNKRPSSLANIEAENLNGNACTTYFTVPFMRYYSTGGTATYTNSISYGIYPALTAATFSNSTSNTPTVTVKTPAIYARCNATYFATARAPELDQSASKFRVTGKVYRVEREDAVEAFYREFYERYNAEQ